MQPVLSERTSLKLRWQSTAGESYDVYGDMGTGFGIFIHKGRAYAGEYGDGGLWPGTPYRYIVVEHSEGGGHSAEVQVKTSGYASREGIALVSSTPVVTSAIGVPAQWTAIPRPTVTPSPTSGPPTPTTTPVPADTILLGLMSSNDYVDDLGYVVIVGEVRNDAPSNATDAQIMATFYNARGEIIQQKPGRPLINILKPRQRSPFIISLPKPSDLWEWSLQATAHPTLEDPQSGLTIRGSRAAEDKTGFYHVTGQVINEGNQPTRLAQVVVTLYDKWGKVINAGFAYTVPSVIEVGGKAEFDCSFSYFPTVTNHSIQIEWE